MAKREKVYFASDFHLGSPNHAESKEREKKICNWLDNIAENAKEIYLVGDIFDFWFEYKRVIPKGFERLKGKLAHFTDQGIKIHFFPGNHDLWTFGYLEKELGLIVHYKPLVTKIEDKTFYICHGDGLGNSSAKYKILKSIFSSSACQWLFSKLNPNLGIKLAHTWSGLSRKKGGQFNKEALRESLIEYSKEILTNKDINYFVFGHIHEPIEIELTPSAKYINLGDWINHFSYIEYQKGSLLFKYF
ncbi:MAG: UDP-2,3-diacylglucosamine diphosphatase [Flavobacteriales bacterium TMED191]|nr:MAG: UDP-2,3-diacylglucosamine diphosphatase [Flavobacteriales bacterium TMED191]|tara:strand:+ start:35 stop:772 length:738 start_codon:yes stop_codon:yes gene_type:complete